MPPTHYETLGVPRDASPDAVRAAFRRLAMEHHPDRNPQDLDGAHKRMIAVNVAYQILIDPKRRGEYDAWLDAGAGQPTPEQEQRTQEVERLHRMWRAHMEERRTETARNSAPQQGSRTTSGGCLMGLSTAVAGAFAAISLMGFLAILVGVVAL